MNKKKGHLFVLLLVGLIVVVGMRYKQYIFDRHFQLKVSAVCNPETEKCFVSDCLPESDQECDTTPYKKVEIIDSFAPTCLEEHTCEYFSCDKISSDKCSVTYCSQDVLEEGEVCLDIGK